MKEQILRWVARERQLGIEHQICTEFATRLPRAGDDLRRIATHVPDQEVELRQRDLQRFSHGRSCPDAGASPAMRRLLFHESAPPAPRGPAHLPCAATAARPAWPPGPLGG